MYFIGIEAFLAIVESGSISKAADLLHISQSSVSYRLKTLENELGFQLLERHQGVRGITLTSQGHSYLNVAEKLMILKNDTDHIRKMDYKINVRIGVADSISLFLLPELYKSVIDEFEEIRPFIMTQHTIETYETIKSKEMDIGFVKSEFNMPNVFVKKIIDEEMVLVRYGSSSKYTQPIAPSELESKDEIFMDWGYAYQIWHDNWWKPDDYLIRVDAAHLVFNMLDHEDKWTIVPRSIYNAFADKGVFIEQKLTSSPPNRSCFMIYHKYADKLKQPFISYVEQYLRDIYKI
ncbi:LysR family transcriptional regulator [Fusibacter ferrireducens]|uniref:LysR family transcriptional regulator n=1 Tax=Fusibacter ferrireducens TaxID=2785058 RepID=A0ABR9ZTJ7_9FIRM|nr:LysR family transcriptional regulator [Fusibacter ferrireducens]MBF4693468.1 LysR family transcriptional regulator [Fusibacter ferrireducens]